MVNTHTNIEIVAEREKVSTALMDNSQLLAILGPCAVHRSVLIREEGQQINALADVLVGVTTVHRIPVWKPRTPRPGEKPWEGLETTEPGDAIDQISDEVSDRTNVAIEISKQEHIEKYHQLLSFGWIGSRNSSDTDLLELASSNDDLMRIPIGVKNELQGDLAATANKVNSINLRRRSNPVNGVQPAFAIYRGGSEALTPESWECEYRLMHCLTGGKFIVDVAHGSEIAHDDDSKKSVTGQLRAAEHVIKLAELGLAPAGIMIEASDFVVPDIDRRTDPNMPLESALEIVRNLSKAMIRNES